MPGLDAGTAYYYRFDSHGARAYYEWMPIREDAQTKHTCIYRAFRCGDLATLLMLRYAAGWPRPAGASRGHDHDRVARTPVAFDMIERAKVGNLAVLTGDVHSSWAYDLPRDPFAAYDGKTGKGSLGVEFAGTSVSSPSNLGAGPDGEQQLADLRAARPHLHYVDGRYRGYFVVDLTRERLQADFYAVASVLDRTTTERFEKGFVTASGTNHLVGATTPAPTAKSPDPAP